jgi:PAS domain S-box-containing protein
VVPTLSVIYPWIVPLAALVVYGALLLAIIYRRDWNDAAARRLVFYLLVAMVAQAVLLVSINNAADTPLFRAYLYAQAALPLFFLAFARAFIRVEQKPWAFLVGLALLIAIIVADGLQASLHFATGTIPTSTIVFAFRAVLWIYVTAYVVIVGAIEYSRVRSPLSRNRLWFLGIALPFFLAYDGLHLILGNAVRPFLPAVQIVGILIAAYATLQHDLIDLRDLARRGARNVFVTIFAMVIYTLVIEAALEVLAGIDPRQGFAGAFLVAVGLAFFFQPLRDLVQQISERLLFGRRYDVRAVVQNFTRQLAEQIELNGLAAKGSALLRQTMGAHDVALLLVNKDEAGYSLDPVLEPDGVAAAIHLDATSSVARALTSSDRPLPQYDIDRLPQYADISKETLAALQRLHGEVFLPIRSRDALIGIWVVGARLSGDRYNATDLSLLSTLATQSAVALENARLLADLRDQMGRLGSMHEYLDSTLASIATGVITLDPEGRINSLNRAAETIFRVTSMKCLGRSYADVLPRMEGAELSILLARLWASQSQRIVREVITRVDGRGDVHLTLHLSGIWRAQEMVGVALMIEDLTEQAKLESERRAQEEETQRVRATFEHYVAPAVVDGLLADPKRIMLGGERQVLTVLFADIHGFTKLSEGLLPEHLVEVLNGYLSLAYQAVLRYEGTLDKFLGDGMMAIFNAPLPQSDHAWRAARAALTLQREVAAYVLKLPPPQRLTFRLGLHTGEAVVGNIGAHELMNYTAVGDTVNIAKRLQEGAENSQILISRSTYSLIENKVVVRPREKMTIRGREAPVEVFELVGAWEEK